MARAVCFVPRRPGSRTQRENLLRTGGGRSTLDRERCADASWGNDGRDVTQHLDVVDYDVDDHGSVNGCRGLRANGWPSCTATISNPRPTRGATVTVSIMSNQPNAPVQLVIDYRTTTMNQSATTDSTGSANVAVSIGAATVGYAVDVAIAIGTARCSTTFTPAA